MVALDPKCTRSEHVAGRRGRPQLRRAHRRESTARTSRPGAGHRRQPPLPPGQGRCGRHSPHVEGVLLTGLLSCVAASRDKNYTKASERVAAFLCEEAQDQQVVYFNPFSHEDALSICWGEVGRGRKYNSFS